MSPLRERTQLLESSQLQCFHALRGHVFSTEAPAELFYWRSFEISKFIHDI